MLNLFLSLTFPFCLGRNIYLFIIGLKKKKTKIILLYHVELRAPSRCNYSSSLHFPVYYCRPRRQYVVVVRLHCPIKPVLTHPCFFFFLVVFVVDIFSFIFRYNIKKCSLMADYQLTLVLLCIC